MRRVIVTLGAASALLGCAPSKEVTPEDLLETFQTSRPGVDVRAAALEVLAAEGFRILSDDGEVRASLRAMPPHPSEVELYRAPVYFTVVVVKVRAVQEGTRVSVVAYRERENRRNPDVREPEAATLDEVHWCETVAEKLKRALGQLGM